MNKLNNKSKFYTNINTEKFKDFESPKESKYTALSSLSTKLEEKGLKITVIFHRFFCQKKRQEFINKNLNSIQLNSQNFQYPSQESGKYQTTVTGGGFRKLR